MNTHNAWRWEATYPQVYPYDNDPSKAEEVSFSVGQNLSYVVEFKWLDNTQSPGDITDMYINGDTAPSGRLRYRLNTARTMGRRSD